MIDPTEALVSIDINSSRATKGVDIEETALNTNIEAAEEIARQLRLRDMGGLIVIDFIDMNNPKNQREVENKLKDATESDRARVQVGRISRFGLLEMSRQRLRPSLEETSGHVCPRCNGQGVIRDVKSLALAILRLVEEESLKERTAQIRAILPISVATFLLNEKRNAIGDIEARSKVQVLIIPNAALETPHYEVIRIRDDSELIGTSEPSFAIQLTEVESGEIDKEEHPHKPAEKPAISTIATHSSPAPASSRDTQTQQTFSSAEEQKKSLLGSLIGSIAGIFGGAKVEQPQKVEQPATRTRQEREQKKAPTQRSQQNSSNRGNKTRSNSKTRAERPKTKDEDRRNKQSTNTTSEQQPASKTTPTKKDGGNANRRPERDNRGAVNSEDKGSNRKKRTSPNKSSRRQKLPANNDTQAVSNEIEEQISSVKQQQPVQEKSESFDFDAAKPVQEETSNQQKAVTEAKTAEADKTNEPADSVSKTQPAESKPENAQSNPVAEKPAAVEAAPVTQKAEAAQENKPEEDSSTSQTDTDATPKRAFNDPREIKRRMLEEQKAAEADNHNG